MLEYKINWNALNLHDVEKCHCDRVKLGKAKKSEINEKKQAFYKSETGFVI